MKNKLKVFEPTRIKALVLAGVTLFSGTACGKKNIEKEEPQAIISVEEDTTKKKNNIETTVENMIEGKTTGENNGTGEEYSYTEDGYTEYVDPTEEIIEEQTEGKTEAKTEAKTEGKTESKTESVQSPFEHRVGNASPEKQTEAPTQKATQKTTNKITTTIKNKDIKITTTAKKVTTAKPTTTKKVTTTTKVVTTQKPTTQKPTEPPTTQPPAPTYDYTLENITQSAEVFNYFADQMNRDIYQGADVLRRRFDGEEHWDNGALGSKVALLILNENANYKDGVLREVFKGYNDSNITDGVTYFYAAPGVEKMGNSNIDFNKYSLDKNVGNYMNKLKDARKNGDSTGNYDEMDRILEDFFYNEVYDEAYFNIAAFYYTVGTGVTCSNSAYFHDCISFTDNGNFYGVQNELENKVKELSR